MFKISTRVRYGLRTMIWISSQNESCHSTNEIARNICVSDKYLEQILTALRKAKLVTALKGVKGGYSLGKPVKEISILDIATALEGPICLVDCVKKSKRCIKSNACHARPFWQCLLLELETYLKKIKLADLTNDRRRKRIFKKASLIKMCCD